MILAQNFSVKPQGYLQGGTVSYSIDTLSGIVQYQYDITAKLVFFTKEFKDSGFSRCDPKQLLSASIVEGEVLNIGPVAAKIVRVDKVANQATCQLTIESDQVHEAGQVIFDLSNQYVKIIDVKEVGKVVGFEVDLELIPA